MVSNRLKNISQIGNLPQIGMKKQMLETMLVLTLSFQLYGPPKKWKKSTKRKISLSETVVFPPNGLGDEGSVLRAISKVAILHRQTARKGESSMAWFWAPADHPM